MKNYFYLLFPLSLVLVIIFTSCEDKEHDSIRTFEQDAEILYHFACINRSEVQYYLAFGEDNDHLDRIPHYILESLSLVSDENLARFIANVDELNAELRKDMTEFTSVLLATLYDRYIYYPNGTDSENL